MSDFSADQPRDGDKRPDSELTVDPIEVAHSQTPVESPSPQDPHDGQDAVESNPTTDLASRGSVAGASGDVTPPEGIAPAPTQWAPPAPNWEFASADTAANEAPTASQVAWPAIPVAAGAAGAGAADQATEDRQRSPWLALVLVAALVGGIVGGGVGWLTRNSSSNTSQSVTIQSNTSAPGAAILASGTSIPALVDRVSPSVVSVTVNSAQEEDEGSGMIVSSDGLVVTNNHVIAAALQGGTITVTRTGTTAVLPAKLVGTDPSADVALLQIEGVSGLPTVTFGNSKSLVVGDAVVAIGNALGLSATTPTVTQGIVSALGRTVTAGDSTSTSTETLNNMIQTDAAINPGNSGGPLLDSSGRVIGMNTAVAGTTSDGTNAQNIGFAIPSARVLSLIPSLLKGGSEHARKGGYLGVYIETNSRSLAAQYNLSTTTGAVVVEIQQGLPAANAGIQQGDVIVSIGSTQIKTAAQVSAVMAKSNPGEVVQVGIIRGTQHLTIPVTLGTPPAV